MNLLCSRSPSPYLHATGMVHQTSEVLVTNYNFLEYWYSTIVLLLSNSQHRIFIFQRVMFNILNISKLRNLFCDGMTPIVKSSSKKKW